MSAEFLQTLWGYCPSCERWRLSAEWGPATSPACPLCGAPPAAIERLESDRLRMDLELEVAVGPVGRRHFLPE